jgi:hypothetical protein
VLKVVTDSGVLYSVTLIASLICIILQSNVQYIMLDMIMPIISIAFYLVIFRLGLEREKGGRGDSTFSATGGRSGMSGMSEHDRMGTSMRQKREEDRIMFANPAEVEDPFEVKVDV